MTQINKITNFVIKRNEWYPSEVHGDVLKIHEGVLYNGGRRCCLGAYLNACGIPDEEMEDAFMPDDLDIVRNHPELSVLLCSITEDGHVLNSPSEFAKEAANWNDKESIYTKEKEQKIIDLFAAQGITVTFEGDLNLDEVNDNKESYGVIDAD